MSDYNDNLHTAVQIVVDEKKLLEAIGWTDAYQTMPDGEWEEVGGKADFPHQLMHLIAQNVSREIAPDIKKQVLHQISSQVESQVAEIVAETVNGSIRQTNTWGEPTGDPTTMREMLAKEVKEVIARKVNSRGETDRFGGNGSIPYITYLVRKEADQLVKTELKSTIDAAMGNVRAVVTEVVSAELGERLARKLNP
ncbi:hypothetical protein SEA_SCENTAE_79 [Gordonia phage SCentae]|nr:hypothetical protein SEA_SCENTAE_79 [Gordonia phage SCentae]